MAKQTKTAEPNETTDSLGARIHRRLLLAGIFILDDIGLESYDPDLLVPYVEEAIADERLDLTVEMGLNHLPVWLCRQGNET